MDSSKTRKTLPERIILGISFTLRTLILIGVISAIVNKQWDVLFISGLALVLTFLPAILKKNYKVKLPAEFELAIVLFIYAAIIMGEIGDYYTKYPWWDLLLHTFSGFALGIIGFIILFVLYKVDKIKARPITIAVFSFCFALALGAVWEIFEFTIDQVFGTIMQRNSLHNTMWDLIVDSIGALMTSTAGYIYLKYGKGPYISRSIRIFFEKNPHMLK